MKNRQKRVHFLQHVPFEDSANIGLWAQKNGYLLTNTKLFNNENLPDENDIDILAIMGGPMNIYQYRDYPWLKDEKIFIEKAIAKKVKIIGVCLGAQLIADVLGVKISQNHNIEIGWHDIQLTETGTTSKLFKNLPNQFTAFHWHGDTFEIPTGALHLAKSKACENQAFQYDNNVIALQFHLEYSVESIEKMLEHCSNELIDTPFVQKEKQIRQGYSYIDKDMEYLNILLGQLSENND